jgi:hypothetical protein
MRFFPWFFLWTTTKGIYWEDFIGPGGGYLGIRARFLSVDGPYLVHKAALAVVLRTGI